MRRLPEHYSKPGERRWIRCVRYFCGEDLRVCARTGREGGKRRSGLDRVRIKLHRAATRLKQELKSLRESWSPRKKNVPQGLKPASFCWAQSARLKSVPFQNRGRIGVLTQTLRPTHSERTFGLTEVRPWLQSTLRRFFQHPVMPRSLLWAQSARLKSCSGTSCLASEFSSML